MIARCIAVAAILGWPRPSPTVAAASNQWIALAQFAGSGTCSVAVSPGFAHDRTIWAGTPGFGLYVSRDGGSSWAGIDIPGANLGACPVALSPVYSSDRTILVTTDEPYISRDDGATWTVLTVDMLPSAYAFSPDFATDRTILAAADSGPIYRSTDGGLTWTQVANWREGLPAAGHFSVDQLTLSASGVAMLATDDGVFRSEDRGATWSAANAGLPVVNTVDPSTGETFRRVPPAAGEVVPDQPSGMAYLLLDLRSGAQLFVSVDGDPWTATGNPLIAQATSLILEAGAQGATLVVGSANAGVFTTINAGQTWIPFDRGLSDEDVAALAFSGPAPGALIAGGSYDGVFVRASGASAWSTGYAGMPQIDPTLALIRLSGQPEGMLLAGALSGAFRSTDGGQSWRPFDTGLPGERSVTSFASAGKEVFAATTSGVFESSKVGGHWREVGSHLMRGVAASAVAAQATCAGMTAAIAAGTENGLFSSPDGSHHWHMVVAGDMNIEALAYSPTHAGALYALCDGQLELYSSGRHRVVAEVQQGRPLAAFALSPENGRPLVIATRSVVYRRSGNHWIGTVRLDGVDRPLMAFAGRSRVLLADGASLLTSSDDRHWTEYSTPGGFAIAAVAPLPGEAAIISLAGAGLWRFHG